MNNNQSKEKKQEIGFIPEEGGFMTTISQGLVHFVEGVINKRRSKKDRSVADEGKVQGTKPKSRPTIRTGR